MATRYLTAPNVPVLLLHPRSPCLRVPAARAVAGGVGTRVAEPSPEPGGNPPVVRPNG
ncbi:hypothetical protein ACIRRH_19930 [Kitasatospora sp. NPDC101235]|uniref:hypothetical protein n=1 Tax=Kitasatospora sp. NPDC101235 TaxID=3364101 RepID=UPI003810F1FD